MVGSFQKKKKKKKKDNNDKTKLDFSWADTNWILLFKENRQATC